MYNNLTLSQLTPQLTDALDTAGLSLLNKYPAVRLWRQMESRLQTIYQIEKSMTKFMHSKESANYDSLKFMSYFFGLQQMKRYVQSARDQLDINNTIDHTPTGNLAFTWEQHEDDAIFRFSVPPFTPLVCHWRSYWNQYPKRDLLALFSDWHIPASGTHDDAAKLLIRSTYAQRRSTIMSRMCWQLRDSHHSGWFMVFDTLTLSPDMVTRFYENSNALRDYFRNVGRSVLSAEKRSPRQSFDDCYKYICIPEYGSERGRLHFHIIHFLRTLPTGAKDPNIGRRTRNRRQVDFFRGLWPYGTTQPIAIRYQRDAFTRKGWLWPVDANGKAIDAKPYIAVGYYVTKYVCKNVDAICTSNLQKHEASKWNKTVQTLIPDSLRKAFRVRMSRTFGQAQLNLSSLKIPQLLELTRLHHSVTPYTQMLKRLSKRELVKRASTLSVKDIMDFMSEPTNLLASLRRLMKTTQTFSLASFMSTVTRSLHGTDVSDETKEWLRTNQLDTASVTLERGSTGRVFGSK